MATSGSWNYSLTAANLIVMSAEDLHVIQNGEAIDSDDQTTMLRALNVLAKQWQATADMAQGLKVWTRQRVTLALALGQQEYLVGPASGDSRASTQMGRTTISASEAAGQTVISITSNTDTTTYPGTTITMTASDIVGIQTDDSGGDDIFWSTISGTPASTMTIAAALPAGRPAASGNYVWWFTSRAQRLPHIDTVLLRNSSRIDTPLAIFRNARDYNEGVGNKYSDGDPTAILIEPQLLNTRLTIDSQPTDVTKQLILIGYYPAEDYDATTDDIAFPQEWFAALEWELARRCAPKFHKTWTQEMQMNWEQSTQIARQLNPENAPEQVYFRRDD